jgi:tRNA(fMet)-specific endonuclease VapC
MPGLTYLLDTNVCIKYLNGRSESIRNKLARTPPSAVAVCSIVKAELYAGAHKTANPAVTLARQQRFLNALFSFPFDDAAAAEYGRLRAILEIAGTPIGPHDLEIASIALANDLTLVTNNIREFGRISGLKIEDW